MPNNFEALAVVAIALVPGLLATLAYEQWAGRSGRAFADRTLRLITVSAVAVVITAWPLYLAWDRFVVSRDVVEGRPLPWWIWLALIAWVLVPWQVGTRIGRAAKERRKWVQIFTGPAPEPRAWDHLFNTRSRLGWVRLRLLDDSWIFGSWSHPEHESARSGDLRAYAAGYPDEQDLFLPETFEVDEDGYGLYESEEDDDPIPRGVALLVRWSEIRYLEYIDRSPPHPVGGSHGALAANAARSRGRTGEEGGLPGGAGAAFANGAATPLGHASTASAFSTARAQLSQLRSAIKLGAEDPRPHHGVHPRTLSDLGLTSQSQSAHRSAEALRSAQHRQHALVPVCASLAVVFAVYGIAALIWTVGPASSRVGALLAAGLAVVVGFTIGRRSRRLGNYADRAFEARDAYDLEKERRSVRRNGRGRRGITMPATTRLRPK